MSTETIFQLHLVLGYVAWLLCFSAYILPKLRSLNRLDAHRAIATLHSFRFFGLVFILPGVVGPHLPSGFAAFAAYGDFATGVLAILALLVLLMVGAAALITFTGSWQAVGDWFVASGPVGVTAWLLVPTVLAALAGFAVLGRATPRS